MARHFTNPGSRLETKAEVQESCRSLLAPLLPFFTPGNTCVKLGNTATRYDEVGAQLEGYSRPLWGLAALIAGGGSFEGTEQFVDGLRNGTNPEHPEYWGLARDLDQRMVEMCPIGFTLAVASAKFWDPLTQQEKDNIAAWLGYINDKEMPNTNWLWFRVFANLGLAKNGAKFSKERLEADCDHLDTFYRGDGWSNDGPEGYTQMDYYSGSFAIQLLQLFYAEIAKESDPKRAEEYKERARLYALDFVHYFDEQGTYYPIQFLLSWATTNADICDSPGRAITFGRSLTYRHAMAGFWASVAFANVDLPAPLTWGVVKGILLRNLRWWTTQKEALSPQGTLTIGYTYPNQFMSENYNSPGSPYWFMLSFAALAVPDSHPFWTSKEEPYPSSSIPPVKALAHPKHIMVRKGGHTFLLSSGQMCHYPVRASESKYGKFAYSSAFGYSVPTGDYFLQAIGGDNMIAFSDDEGERWRVRRISIDPHLEERDDAPVLVSGWKPWKDVSVDTYLVPPTDQAPNWHLRVHHVRTERDLKSSEGAWCLFGTQVRNGRELEVMSVNALSGGGGSSTTDAHEGRYSNTKEALAVSRGGAVGVIELHSAAATSSRNGVVLDADANGCITDSRSVLPTLAADLKAGEEVWWVTAVFAMPESVEGWKGRWREGWDRKPVVPGWVGWMMGT
ncbi:hypothetical protein MMC25_000504 [Agyrium rufum]|nr:hypothetical protein [Agyrium rufum]